MGISALEGVCLRSRSEGGKFIAITGKNDGVHMRDCQNYGPFLDPPYI